MSAPSGQVPEDMMITETMLQYASNRLSVKIPQTNWIAKKKSRPWEDWYIHLDKIVSVCFSHFSFLPEPGRNLRTRRRSWKRKMPLCRWKTKEGALLSWPTASATVQETGANKEISRGLLPELLVKFINKQHQSALGFKIAHRAGGSLARESTKTQVDRGTTVQKYLILSCSVAVKYTEPFRIF